MEETLELLRQALALHLENLVSNGLPIPEALGIENYLRSETDRPGPNDLIGFVPVRDVLPGMVA